eukprot:scaffold1371_cov77-Skeletonema_dohrnii-CCMP3373.AAC.5
MPTKKQAFHALAPPNGGMAVRLSKRIVRAEKGCTPLDNNVVLRSQHSRRPYLFNRLIRRIVGE